MSRVFVARTFFDGLVIAQPFLIQATINSVSGQEITSNVSNGLIGGTALLFVALCVGTPPMVRITL